MAGGLPFGHQTSETCRPRPHALLERLGITPAVRRRRATHPEGADFGALFALSMKGPRHASNDQVRTQDNRGVIRFMPSAHLGVRPHCTLDLFGADGPCYA